MDEGAHDPGADRGDSLVSAPGRSPALDAGQLEVLRRYGTERDVAATPLFLETSRPGIFAIGDVRSGSVKRAAAAIGEGSMAVRLVFDRLKAAGSTNAIDLGPPA